MSTTMTHYVMVAIKFPFDEISERSDIQPFDDNGYSDEVTITKDLTAVGDGMNGGYYFIGEVLTKGLEHEGLTMTQCMLPMSRLKKIEKKVLEVFGLKGKASAYAFTHWH